MILGGVEDHSPGGCAHYRLDPHWDIHDRPSSSECTDISSKSLGESGLITDILKFDKCGKPALLCVIDQKISREVPILLQAPE